MANPNAKPAQTAGQKLSGLITRTQGPESEQQLIFAANSVVSTPTALRTDRKIAYFYVQFMGRITNNNGAPTMRSNGILGSPLFNILQFLTVRGQHSVFGTQQPRYIRAVTMAEIMSMYYAGYSPSWWTSQNGGALTKSGAYDTTSAHTNDVIITFPVPLFPLGIAANDIPSYCLNGPDWAGNLYMDIQCGDGTVLASANAPTSFTAYGSNAGSPSLNILSVRPLLTKNVAAAIVPAVDFLQTFFQQPTTVVAGQGGTGVQLSTLVVGRDTTRVISKFGTVVTPPTSGLSVYDTLSDAIATRTYVSLDSHPLPNRNSNTDYVLQDFQGLQTGRTQPQGYRVIEFIETLGQSSVANPRAAFPSSTLTAARKFEIDADITSASGQIAEVVQGMLLGAPGWRGSAS